LGDQPCAATPVRHLRFAVGEYFPLWQLTAVCEDGAIVADIPAARAHAGATRFAD
jgi:hypothetical protein